MKVEDYVNVDFSIFKDSDLNIGDIEIESFTVLSVYLLLGVATLCLMVRILHLASSVSAPDLYYKNSAFNRKITEACPLLTEVYVPPLLWGKSGHIQTLVYGMMGRVRPPTPLLGERCSVPMPDGATMTFDIFEPLKAHHEDGDYTLVLCPGIANSSESHYIITCVENAQHHGYRVAVLNHLGAIKSIELTSPRIFTYGGTEEYRTMVEELRRRYPSTNLIAVGFSMGANIVLKYMGENIEHQQHFMAAMSFCQGYDIERNVPYMLSWSHLRRLYVAAMTINQRSLLRHHRKVLFSPEAHAKYGSFDEKTIQRATSLLDIDEQYSRRRAGFSSVHDYYRSQSSAYYLDNIDIPTLIVNSLDDPIIANDVHNIPKELAIKKDKVVFCTPHHGGHLGFYEGTLFFPDTLTWLDKMVVQYADAVIHAIKSKE